MDRSYHLLIALVGVCAGVAVLLYSTTGVGQQQERTTPARDAIEDAQTPRQVQLKRPEQQKNSHDRSDAFDGTKAPASSPVLENQPDQGKALGFDFARDPFNAKRPMQPAEEIMKNDIAEKPKVTAAQQKLMEQRYDLKVRVDSSAKMSRGKPLPVGPTARLPKGLTWQGLAQMTSAEIRKPGAFPYPSMPHPKHASGGMVFPQAQIEMFPRLERFDVEFDIPEAFLSEFPPAIFLQTRPELGDVSRGEVVSINNFYRLFKDLLTPVQLDGLQFLVTQPDR
jgi:hypothetical protein